VINRELQDLVYRGFCSVEDADKAVVFGLGLRLGLIGPHFVLELGGGSGGIRDNMTRYTPEKTSESSKNGFSDLTSWTRRPDGYVDIAYEGVQEAFKNRKPEEGQDHDGLECFRDRGLITLLKFHGKY
jgi:3-hydroxyacyl-CoA dehydrogenase